MTDSKDCCSKCGVSFSTEEYKSRGICRNLECMHIRMQTRGAIELMELGKKLIQMAEDFNWHFVRENNGWQECTSRCLEKERRIKELEAQINELTNNKEN